MRVFVIFLVIFISIDLNAQPLRTGGFEYFDYNSVIKDLNKNGQDSKFYEHLDYESMLFLDKSSIKTLIKVNPKFLKEYGIDTTNIYTVRLNQSYNEFTVESNSLKDFFNNKTLLDKTLDQIDEDRNRNINNTIYIKNDQIAILTIWDKSWTKTYKATLVDRKVRFELVFETIE